jgi:hypothetical protein
MAISWDLYNWWGLLNLLGGGASTSETTTSGLDAPGDMLTWTLLIYSSAKFLLEYTKRLLY